MRDLLKVVGIKGEDTTIQHCWEALSKSATGNDIPVQVDSFESEQPEGGSNDSLTPTSVAPSETTFGFEGMTDLGLTLSQVAIDPAELVSQDCEALEQVQSTSKLCQSQSNVALPREGQVCLQFLQCGELDEPVYFKIQGSPTVDQLQNAESNFRGHKRKAAYVFEDGCEVSPTHVVQHGSIYLLDFGHENVLSAPVEEPDESQVPSPQPISSLEVSESSQVAKSDGLSASVNSHEEPLIESDPFHNLSGSGFLRLHSPVVIGFAHAQSLIEQRCPVASRIQSLAQQGGVWSDDEIRWHLNRVQQVGQSHSYTFVIEPLVVHGCFSTLNFRPLVQWFIANHRMNAVYVTVVLQDQHWYPLIIRLTWEGIKVSTWDLPGYHHKGLSEFVHCIAEALGLPVHSIFQLERRFSGENFCGALSIAFLEHHIACTPLPETLQMAESHHEHLRQLFCEAVSAAEITWRPWIWGVGVNDTAMDQAVELLTPILVAHGVPTDHAHHRAQQASKAIGAQDVVVACKGKSPWKTLKTLGTNVKFQFITPDELRTQIEKRAGKGPVGKPVKKNKQAAPKESADPVVLDPMKLGLPEGSFTGGGKPLSQIPVTMLGPVAEGVVIVTWQQAEPYLRASQVIAQGPLALLILQGPTGSLTTTLHSVRVTVPARCLVNQEPLLLEATLVQLGTVRVEKAQIASPVAIDTVQVATIKLTVFRDECGEAWEQVSSAPLKYIIKTIPLLRLCRGENCACPCWHNQEKINTSDAIIDVWRRQFLRAGYKPEPVSSAVMFTVCLRIPQCLLCRILSCSGEGGVYVEPRSMDSREVSGDYEVIWVPKADKAAVSHLRQTNPAATGLARLGDRFGVRVPTSQAAELHKVLRPDAVYLATGVRQHYIVGPIPFGTDRKALCRALSLLPWAVKPLQPVAALDGQRGVMWSVISVEEPPTNIINMSHGEVLITKQKDTPSQKETVKHPVATPSTLSLCGAEAGKGPDPWAKVDPWSGYSGLKNSDIHGTGLANAAASMHQLEHKIEQAVLSKIPQTFAMDQDDVPDKIQDLENKVQTLMSRQQHLEGMVQEQSVQSSAQFSQMQAQINAQGQQISGHMEVQQQQIQQMFESQMSQIRSLLSKRKCDSEHE